jgi:hypothetical protein
VGSELLEELIGQAAVRVERAALLRHRTSELLDACCQLERVDRAPTLGPRCHVVPPAILQLNTITVNAPPPLAHTDGMAGSESQARGWVAGAAIAVAWALLSLVGAVSLALSARWFDAALAIGSARAGYWFAAGAWLRTPWGHLEASDPLPVPPVLTGARARLYVLAVGLVAIALMLALALQALDGRWVQ